jgi:hypothetical protein
MNIKYITRFFQRLLRAVEQELMVHPILPSYLHNKPISARLDAELYLREVSDRLRHYRYTYIVNEEEFHRRMTNAVLTGEDVVRNVVDEIIKAFIQTLRFDIRKSKKIKLGFFCRLSLHCIYEKDTFLFDIYLSSLSHNRKECFVKMISDIDKVLKMLGDEVIIRIYNLEGSQ